MTAPHWDENNLEGYRYEVSDEEIPEWDKVYLAGIRVPGIVSWPEGDREYDLDTKKAQGQKGAKTKQTGKGNDEISFTISLVTQDDWEEWKSLLAIIAPQDQKPLGNPVAILHPAVNVMGVDKVILRKVSYPKKGSTVGVCEIKLKFQQWGPPNKVGVKTGGTVKDSKGNYPPTIIDNVHKLPKDDAKILPGTAP